MSSFVDFRRRVQGFLDQVPAESHYVIFPELFTVGLLTTYPNAERLSAAALTRIDEFTAEYHDLFRQAARGRGQFIVAGSHLERHGERYFNVAHVFTPDGKDLTHKKTHIFPAEAQWHTAEGDDLEVWQLGPAKVGVSVCYEAEIPEVSRILALKGAEIILCPSYTFTEFGFWRVRHCAQARCVENQIYFAHCCTIGHPGAPLPDGFGRSSILSPCDVAWTPNGIVAEAETNRPMVVTGTVEIEALYENRKKGAAPTFHDRSRRADVYRKYAPYQIGW
jgi:predicted amidohydrolase